MDYQEFTRDGMNFLDVEDAIVSDKWLEAGGIYLWKLFNDVHLERG